MDKPLHKRKVNVYNLIPNQNQMTSPRKKAAQVDDLVGDPIEYQNFSIS